MTRPQQNGLRIYTTLSNPQTRAPVLQHAALRNVFFVPTLDVVDVNDEKKFWNTITSSYVTTAKYDKGMLATTLLVACRYMAECMPNWKERFTAKALQYKNECMRQLSNSEVPGDPSLQIIKLLAIASEEVRKSADLSALAHALLTLKPWNAGMLWECNTGKRVSSICCYYLRNCGWPPGNNMRRGGVRIVCARIRQEGLWHGALEKPPEGTSSTNSFDKAGGCLGPANTSHDIELLIYGEEGERRCIAHDSIKHNTPT